MPNDSVYRRAKACAGAGAAWAGWVSGNQPLCGGAGGDQPAVRERPERGRSGDHWRKRLPSHPDPPRGGSPHLVCKRTHAEGGPGGRSRPGDDPPNPGPIRSDAPPAPRPGQSAAGASKGSSRLGPSPPLPPQRDPPIPPRDEVPRIRRSERSSGTLVSCRPPSAPPRPFRALIPFPGRLWITPGKLGGE